MDDNRTTGVRFFAFILATLGLAGLGWATAKMSDVSSLAGAVAGLSFSLALTGIIMFVSTIPDD